MLCKCCGDETSSKFCDFCNKLYFKDEKLRTVKRKKPEKVEKLVQPKAEKACATCNESFKPTRTYPKYCCSECRPKPLTSAEKWLKAKPRVNRMDSNQFAYGFFRKKYGVSNKFSACRG